MKTVTFLNTQPYKEQPVPEVGKEYHIFDDGKIKPTRHRVFTVTKVIPFSKFTDTDILENWKYEIEECHWLYAKETDYIVEARDSEDFTLIPKYFVRTTDGGWFSTGWSGARLDIDGSLYDAMVRWFKEMI